MHISYSSVAAPATRKFERFLPRALTREEESHDSYAYKESEVSGFEHGFGEPHVDRFLDLGMSPKSQFY